MRPRWSFMRLSNSPDFRRERQLEIWESATGSAGRWPVPSSRIGPWKEEPQGRLIRGFASGVGRLKQLVPGSQQLRLAEKAHPQEHMGAGRKLTAVTIQAPDGDRLVTTEPNSASVSWMATVTEFRARSADRDAPEKDAFLAWKPLVLAPFDCQDSRILLPLESGVKERSNVLLRSGRPIGGEHPKRLDHRSSRRRRYRKSVFSVAGRRPARSLAPITESHHGRGSGQDARSRVPRAGPGDRLPVHAPAAAALANRDSRGSSRHVSVDESAVEDVSRSGGIDGVH
jgi:hypothetical protein